MEDVFTKGLSDVEIARAIQEQEELLFRSRNVHLQLQQRPVVDLTVQQLERSSGRNERSEEEEEVEEREDQGGDQQPEGMDIPPPLVEVHSIDDEEEEEEVEEIEEEEEEEEEEEHRKARKRLLKEETSTILSSSSSSASLVPSSRGRRRGRWSGRNSAGETPKRINAAIRGSIARRRPLASNAESKSAFQQLSLRDEGAWEINDFSYENLCNLEEVKVGCPSDILMRLPIRTFSEADMRQGKYSECIICICNFAVGDRVKTLPCLHLFHEACIDEWLRHKNTCPVDKIRVSD